MEDEEEEEEGKEGDWETAIGEVETSELKEERIRIGRVGKDKQTTGNENRLERWGRDMRMEGSWDS